MIKLNDGTPMAVGKNVFTRKQTAKILGVPEEAVDLHIRKSDCIRVPGYGSIDLWSACQIISYLERQELICMYKAKELRSKNNEINALWFKYYHGY